MSNGKAEALLACWFIHWLVGSDLTSRGTRFYIDSFYSEPKSQVSSLSIRCTLLSMESHSSKQVIFDLSSYLVITSGIHGEQKLGLSREHISEQSRRLAGSYFTSTCSSAQLGTPRSLRSPIHNTQVGFKFLSKVIFFYLSFFEYSFRANHTFECSLVIPHSTTWMNLRDVLLHESI